MIFAQELHKAVVKALKDNAELSALVNNRIYDETPSDPVYPLVYVGGMTYSKMDNLYCMYDAQITIQAFSNERSVKEITQIAGLIENVMEALSSASFNVGSVNHVGSSFPNITQTVKQCSVVFDYELAV